ncbi:MAG TPA: TPM domain-containing protein [Bacteroidales bacterium]|nr:TPM domain-containing protein [Bacteroidales bacterium]
MKTSTFFTQEEKDKILSSIREAEKETSGEIRLHIDSTCKEDVLDRAAWMFKKLGMEKTAERNGVLFYLALNDRKFAIIGDAGINSKVPEGFWDCVKELLARNFSQGKFSEGLSEGILLAGKQLKTHFPCAKEDKNELSDDISFGKGEDRNDG